MGSSISFGIWNFVPWLRFDVRWFDYQRLIKSSYTQIWCRKGFLKCQTFLCFFTLVCILLVCVSGVWFLGNRRCSCLSSRRAIEELSTLHVGTIRWWSLGCSTGSANAWLGGSFPAPCLLTLVRNKVYQEIYNGPDTAYTKAWYCHMVDVPSGIPKSLQLLLSDWDIKFMRTCSNYIQYL